jgi:hypothetical protein
MGCGAMLRQLIKFEGQNPKRCSACQLSMRAVILEGDAIKLRRRAAAIRQRRGWSTPGWAAP